MRVADLTPPHRKLLRHAGRIDPSLVVLQRGELKTAGELRGHGLLEVTDGAVPVLDSDPIRDDVQYYGQITDAGRRALR